MSLLLAAGLSTSVTAIAAETEAEEETTLEEVTVVGSRIRRDTFSTPSPITVITRDEATNAGFASTTEILQSSSLSSGTAQINNAYGGYVVDGGPGVNTISLRGLGATRTLVLINGRRVAPAGTRGAVGAADLNVLPSAMVDRIEILKDGASSIYGSDAVAGVVNIITKQNASGLTLEGQYTQPFDGAGEQVRASAVFGSTGDRYSFAGSGEYYVRSNLTVGDRDWAADCPNDMFYHPITGAFLGYTDPKTGKPKCWGLNSGGVTINTIGTSARAGVPAIGNPALATFNRWRPNSSVTTGITGFEGVSGGSTDVRDTFHPDFLKESLISPAEIWTGFLQGSYDLQALGNAEVYGELLLHRRESHQIGTRQFTLDYRQGSPLIPANLGFNTTAPFAPDQGMSGGDNVGVRVFAHYGTYLSEQSLDYVKPTVGIRGDLFGGWRYDAYASYAKSSASYLFEVPLTSRMIYSSDVVAATPGISHDLIYAGWTCRINQTDPDERCFPMPPLNTETIGGIYPEGFKNYVKHDVVGDTDYEELLLSAVFDGDLFQMPYGTVKGVVGLEHRRAEIDDKPDPQMLAGNLYGFTSSLATKGKDNVTELFGEVEVPLLVDLPFASELTFNGSYRYTDYDSFGSDSTWKVGLVYSPTTWVSLRGTLGTSYRAPALYEQFLGATSGFQPSTNDPCNEWDTANLPGSNVYENCQSEGLPLDYTATTSVRVLSAGGAAAGLGAETSDALSAGIIFEPELGAWGDLSLAADFWELRVDDGVAQAGFGYVLDQCYSDPDFALDNNYCALVERDPNTRALTVTDGFVNLATDVVRGFEYQLRYETDIGAGTLRVNAQATQTKKQGYRLFVEDELEKLAGTIYYPRWSGTVSTTYTRGLWQGTWGVDVVGEQDSTEYFGLPELNMYDFHVGTYITHYASVRYRKSGWDVTAGVRNLFDKEPPTISATGYNRVGNSPLYSAYDFVGRRAFLTIARSF